MQSHGSDHQSSGCTSKAIKVRPGEQGSVLSQWCQVVFPRRLFASSRRWDRAYDKWPWFHQLLTEQPRDDGARRAGRALHRHGQCQRGPCASVARAMPARTGD